MTSLGGQIEEKMQIKGATRTYAVTHSLHVAFFFVSGLTKQVIGSEWVHGQCSRDTRAVADQPWNVVKGLREHPVPTYEIPG